MKKFVAVLFVAGSSLSFAQVPKPAESPFVEIERRMLTLERKVERLEAIVNNPPPIGNPPPQTGNPPALTGRCVVFGGAPIWRKVNNVWKLDGNVENNIDGTCLGHADQQYGLVLVRLKWQDTLIIVRRKDVSPVGG